MLLGRTAGQQREDLVAQVLARSGTELEQRIERACRSRGRGDLAGPDSRPAWDSAPRSRMSSPIRMPPRGPFAASLEAVGSKTPNGRFWSGKSECPLAESTQLSVPGRGCGPRPRRDSLCVLAGAHGCSGEALLQAGPAVGVVVLQLREVGGVLADLLRDSRSRT